MLFLLTCLGFAVAGWFAGYVMVERVVKRQEIHQLIPITGLGVMLGLVGTSIIQVNCYPIAVGIATWWYWDGRNKWRKKLATLKKWGKQTYRSLIPVREPVPIPIPA